MTDTPPLQWSDEAVADSFCSEIRARFEANNALYRARELAEKTAFFLKHPEKRGQPGYEDQDRDSPAWSFYQGCEIKIDRNMVTIVTPGDSINFHLVYLFDNTTAAWSRPFVKVVLMEGAPRIIIEIILVATWNDSLEAAWRQGGRDQKRILVELFESEVKRLCKLLDQESALFTEEEARKLRERLTLDLEFSE